MNVPFCPGYTQWKPYEGFKMYIAGDIAGECGKIWNNFFEKNAW